jgi:small multidrug resistance pump
VVLAAIAAAIIYKEALDAWAILGMGLIVAGVLLLNLLSRSTPH